MAPQDSCNSESGHSQFGCSRARRPYCSRFEKGSSSISQLFAHCSRKLRQNTFRKRLERARFQIVQFMKARCGLVNSGNACRCHRRLNRAVELNRVDRDHLLFSGDAQNAKTFPDVLREIRTLEETQRAASLYRSHPTYAVPDFIQAVNTLLSTQGRLRDDFR